MQRAETIPEICPVIERRPPVSIGMTRAYAVVISGDRLFSFALRGILKEFLGFKDVHECFCMSDVPAAGVKPPPVVVIVASTFLHGDSSRKLAHLRARFGPYTRIVVITTSLYPFNSRDWLADAVLDDRLDKDDVIEALECVLQGDRIVRLSKPCRDAIAEWERVAPLRNRLTPRMLQVLNLLVAGHSDPEISRILGISVRTAKSCVSAMVRTLRLTRRVHAVAIFAKMREQGFF